MREPASAPPPAAPGAATRRESADAGSPPPVSDIRADASAPAATSAAPAAAASQSVRIDLAKLDRLIDAVGELVIAQSMLAQRLENESFAHIEELALLETLVRDIQEHAMAFRAQPISAVFGRVPRLLRELASNTGKHVKLQVSGETTELDKTVIERLSEPMTHLIRNAVDHGIEPPAERIAAGKEPEGTLSLSAEQKAGRIIIQIRDDGRGINRDKVLAKAIAASGLPHKRFFNTSGQSYRGGGFSQRLPDMTDAQKVAALAADGKLIKRPLVIGEGVVLVGFRPAEWEAALL